MTQTQRTIDFIKTLDKGLVFNYEDYRKMSRHQTLLSYSGILADPARFGVEKIEEWYAVPSSKYTALDVLDMVKQGMSVEDIEPMLWGSKKRVFLRVL